MINPLIGLRTKQRNQAAGYWIYPGNIWTLLSIAKATGQGQIVQGGRATMLTSDDVLDLGKARRRTASASSLI